jgi:hypothetical protein
MPISSLVASSTSRLAFARLVDGDSAIPKHGPIQPVNGCLCLLRVAHLNKAEAFASAGVAISNNLDIVYLANLSKEIGEILCRSLIGKAPNVKSHSDMLLCRHLSIRYRS